jgi:hypothetical protein
LRISFSISPVYISIKISEEREKNKKASKRHKFALEALALPHLLGISSHISLQKVKG